MDQQLCLWPKKMKVEVYRQ